MAADAVVVRDLTRRFGDFVAVDGVSFEVATGEVFGFLGPNGAGKTTTIKMLCGLLEPTNGTATIAGLDITRDLIELKTRIGYMSQLFSLYGDLTVRENIELFGGLYGLAGSGLKERRDWALDVSGLAGHQATMVASLPLGWKQRLALACAMLHQPEVLFLDEPTSGVDPAARRRFWDLIYDLAAAGTTVFVTTHHMEEAEYCHRVAMMNRGRIIALDRPRKLRDALATPVVEITSGDAAAAVPLLRDMAGIIDATMFGRTVHAMVADATRALADIPAVLAAGGVECDSLRVITPSLEDVFVARVEAEGGAVAG